MKVIRLHFIKDVPISFVLNSVLELDWPMDGHKMLLNRRIMIYFPLKLVSHSYDHRYSFVPILGKNFRL